MSKVKISLSIKMLYQSYCIKMKDQGIKPKPFKEYSKIMYTMGEVYADEMLKNGIVQLPRKLGDVFLKNDKNKPLLNKEGTGKPFIQFNDHSGGLKKKFYWLNQARKDKKPVSFTYSADRTMKRKLAKELKAGVKYPDFDKIFNI